MKNTTKFFGIIALAALIGLGIVSCTGDNTPVEPPQPPATPTKVTILGVTDDLARGGQRKFTATVEPSGVSQDVEWSIISPSPRGDITIVNGLLVADAEPGTSITIRATAKGYPTVDDEKTITVGQPVTPTDVTVTPQNVEVSAGGQRLFYATVNPEGAPQKVEWSVEPDEAGSITDGLLTVSEGAQPGNTITVTATAVNHPQAIGTATVTVSEPSKVELTGTVSIDGVAEVLWGVPWNGNCTGGHGLWISLDGGKI